MKNIDFTKAGGFPLKQDTLNFMQESYQELSRALISYLTQGSRFFNARGLGSYILTGLNEEEQNGVIYISAGWVVINDDLLYFAGAPKSAVDNEGIGIQSLSTSTTFKDGSTHSVYLEKIAVAGGQNAVPFSLLIRIATLADLRPILNYSTFLNIATLSPLSSRTININVPVAKEGDVIVASLSENPDLGFEEDESGGLFVPAEFGITDWVFARATAKIDGKVSLFLFNQHSSLPAFGGDIMIRLRILK